MKGGCYQWVYCNECMLKYDCPTPKKKEKKPKYWRFKKEEEKLK